MNEILKKIDEEIETIRNVISDGASSQPYYWSLKGQLEMAQKIKDFILSQQKEPCEWTLEDDDKNIWECNKCGELWALNTGTPKENNMNYCPKCGREIVSEINI
jgi:ribosomal protein L37AE/L43A